MRLRVCGGSLCAHQAASGHGDYATMRLRFCGTTLRRAFVSARCGRARRPRFCGLRCASAGLRYDALAFPRGCVAGARGELGRHYCGVTILYAFVSAGSLVLRRYLGVYGVRKTEVPVLRRYLGARWAEAAFLRGSIMLRLRFCAFLWVSVCFVGFSHKHTA